MCAEKDPREEIVSIFKYDVDDHTEYDVYFHTSFTGKSYDYENLFVHFHREFQPGDIVNIILQNNTGGDVTIATNIANLMRRAEAVVNVYVEGQVSSSAAIVALAGDSLHMVDTSLLYFHNCRITVGDGVHPSETLSLANAFKKDYSILIKKFLIPFLTEEEVEVILDNKEIYIRPSDVGFEKRMERHYD